MESSGASSRLFSGCPYGKYRALPPGIGDTSSRPVNTARATTQRSKAPVSTLCAFLALALLASGCAPARVAAPGANGELQELRLKSGDRIRVVTTKRQRYTFEITEIRPAEFAGVTLEPGPHETLPKGQLIEVPYDELALLEVRRFSAVHTAGAVVGGVFIVGMIGLVVIGAPAVMPGPTP